MPLLSDKSMHEELKLLIRALRGIEELPERAIQRRIKNIGRQAGNE
jgi:hypothetical protein